LYFTQQRLQEWSIVALNSNPDALARNTNDLNEIRKEFTPDTSADSAEDDTDEEKRTSEFDVFEAQLLINKNNTHA
jgi:hypothetical protein